jgi:hypothetical protein
MDDDNAIVMLASIEYVYVTLLGDRSKVGFALKERVYQKNHDISDNEIRMNEIINDFELACSPPTLTVSLSEGPKKLIEMILRIHKTQNYDELKIPVLNNAAWFLTTKI